MRVEHFLEASAQVCPDKLALIEGGNRLTYRALDEAARTLAAALAERGVARGDRVVIFADNCWEAVVGLFGVLKAGAVFCMVNPSTKAEKLRFILDDCKPTAVITIARLLATARAALAEQAFVQNHAGRRRQNRSCGERNAFRRSAGAARKTFALSPGSTATSPCWSTPRARRVFPRA